MLLLRDRLIPLVGIILVSGIAWAYLALLANEMPAMTAMAPMSKPAEKSAALEMAGLLVMWWVMMAAMMLPSAAMMVMTFSTVSRRRRDRDQPYVGTVVFASGYLIAWGGFSLAAAGSQWGLERLALMSPMTAVYSPIVGGGLLIASGLYQFSSLKHACLHHCRSPFDFILNRWREGSAGAMRMGLEHGLYCLGCCWVMMTLLFVFGVMNLLWIAALTTLVLLEKAMPGGQVLARAGGILMIAGGALMIFRTV